MAGITQTPLIAFYKEQLMNSDMHVQMQYATTKYSALN